MLRVPGGHVPEVYVVGPRWPQHSTHSGYDGIHAYVGTYLRPPVESRWPWANNGMQRVVPYPRYLFQEAMSRLLTWISGRTYSLPILRTELRTALHMLRRRGAVYHVLYGETDFWFLGLVARATGNHVVATFHDGESIVRGHGIDARLLRQLDGVIILGEAQRGFFEQVIAPDRIFLVRHGVDVDYFQPDPGVRKERLVITAGGHTRDFETYEEAIKRVWAVDPSVRFVAISTHIGHLGAPFAMDGVEYLSGITDDELLRLYRTASVAAFPFEYAVANNAVLEAMACALPIVATDIGSVREYVSDASGMFVPPRDAETMASAILRLLDDGRLAAEMGAAGRAEAEHLRYERVSEDLRLVYARISGRI